MWVYDLETLRFLAVNDAAVAKYGYSKAEFLTMTDTGLGIAPENISKLFKPFVQIDSAFNRQHTGTGLGLALVKQIVELHNGQVGLTSELGVGSCFTIMLPYEIVTSSSEASEKLLDIKADLTKGNQSPSQLAPLVLLVEDEPNNRPLA